MKKMITFMVSCALFSTFDAQVGIRTANPSAALDIVGLGNTSSTKSLEINNSSGTELLTVLNNGNVGINNSAPTVKLSIVEPGAKDALVIQSPDFGFFKGFVIQDTGGNNTSRFVITPGYIANNNTAALTGVPATNANGRNSVTFDVEGSTADIYTFQEGIIRPGYNNTTDLGDPDHRFGRLYLTNSPNVSSDIRLKENIKNLSYGLKEIMEMAPISYTLKDDANKTVKLGFSAQGMKKIIPEIVETSENKMLGISYTEIIPVLVNALKEQQNKIDALEKKLDSLMQKH
ncbi:tail fiber domain-containing protein [Chryseobacterium daecheongense]|uniref:tail fiber domain-containing protein n=1 Tax=Chryseobacterium daecheongense TaxID=192389 RepID=UPI001FD70981|nr:tail fiber domain-containing protein [Chryseobacterium daecheongense]UOU98124.1 tail fiber domain-containing protein [Chryseobacterium daecheongense]